VASPSVADWLRQAEEHLQDAELLARNHRWLNAYLTGGLAVECVLKGVLMHRLRINRWPDRSEARHFYTHDLASLAALAGIDYLLLVEVEGETTVGVAWQTVKDFALARRYPEGVHFPMRLGRDMIDAISGEEGLIRWLGQLTK
jgi:HEPN domain-containing protein